MTAEYQHIEFKLSVGEKHEATVALAAFATSQGGSVHFGVAPNGRRVGVQIGKTTLEELANYIRQNTDPPLFPDILVEGAETSAVIKVSIAESPIKPVWAFGKPYKRVGRTNQSLSREETQRLADATRGFTWDALPCPGLALEHLSRIAVEDYLKRAGQNLTTPTETVLDNLRLRREEIFFNGAALLFAAEPSRWLDSTKVQCAHFLGKNSVDFLSEQTSYGNVIEQVDAAVDFVGRNTRNSIVITGRPQHERVPEYPVAAVREAIVNAVCHRDYAASGNVQVRIHENYLEISNPGGLPYDLDLESLSRRHHSNPRNKRLAEAFYCAGLIEAWGTGTVRIVESYTDQGLPPPTFQYESGFFILRMQSIPPPFDMPEPSHSRDLSALNERQRKAIEYAQAHGSIVVSQYLTLVAVTDRQARTDLRQLVDRGLLSTQGKGRMTRYVLVP